MVKNIGGGTEEIGSKMNTLAHSFNKCCWRNSIRSTVEQSNGLGLRRPSPHEDNKRKQKHRCMLRRGKSVHAGSTFGRGVGGILD